ncbi:MAG: ABC transporter permease [Acidobacteriota bacterium]
MIHSVVGELYVAALMVLRRWRSSVWMIAAMAVGVAVTTALFTVLDGVLLKPLPFPRPHELFVVGPPSIFRPGEPGTVGRLELNELAARLHAKDAFGMVPAGAGLFDFNAAEQESLRDTAVTDRFFEALGVFPSVGRPLRLSDAVTTGPRPIVISDSLWRSRFGGDRHVLGRPSTIGGRNVAIVGVMPPGVDFPVGTNVWVEDQSPRFSGMRYLVAVVRVDRSPSGEAISHAKNTVSLKTLAAYLRPHGASSILLLFLATAAAVLIAFVHLGAFQIAGTIDRSREIALRAVLGADGARLRRQWLLESVLVSVTGALFAAILAPTVLALCLRLLPTELTSGQPIAVDGRTLTYLVIVATLGATALAIGPMAVVHGTQPADVLRGRLLGVKSVPATRIRMLLLASQVALVTVMFYVAALAYQGFATLNRTDIGLTTDRLFSIDYGSAGLRGGGVLIDDVLRIVKAAPGISSAAIGSVPLRPGGLRVLVEAEDRPTRGIASARSNAVQLTASEGYFQTLGVGLVEGSDHEFGMRSNTVILSRAVVSLLGVRQPVGGQKVYVNGIRFMVAGVADDIRGDGPDRPPSAIVYFPPSGGETEIVVRSSVPTSVGVSAVGQLVRRVTGAASPIRTTIATSVADRATAEPRARATFLSLLAACCLFLTYLAVFSAASEMVTRSGAESSIRAALGATPWDVAKQLVWRLVALIGVGTAVGLGLGTTLGRGASGLFYGLPAIDMMAVIATLLVLGGGSFLVAVLPAVAAVRTK